MQWSTGRVEAFSDGVLAIAITLLVLEIKIEPEALVHPWKALADEWPSYLAYVTSFLTIGGVWIAHHALFHNLKLVDPFVMRLNLLLLMLVSFLPFPTGLMAEALQGSTAAERAALVVYGAAAGTLELIAAALTRYVAANPELQKPGLPPLTAREPRRGGFRAALYALAVLVGILLLPRAAVFVYFGVAALAVLSPRGELKLTLTR